MASESSILPPNTSLLHPLSDEASRKSFSKNFRNIWLKKKLNDAEDELCESEASEVYGVTPTEGGCGDILYRELLFSCFFQENMSFFVKKP